MLFLMAVLNTASRESGPFPAPYDRITAAFSGFAGDGGVGGGFKNALT